MNKTRITAICSVSILGLTGLAIADQDGGSLVERIGLRGPIGSSDILEVTSPPRPEEQANTSDDDTYFFAANAPDYSDYAGYSGDESDSSPSADGFRGRFLDAFDDLYLEIGLPTNAEALGANSVNYARAIFSLEDDLSDQWSGRIGLRADMQYQTGDKSFTDLDLTIDETYLRYRGGDTRITLGWQTVIWGSLDMDPTTDLMSRLDLTHPLEVSAKQRRRPTPAIRLEQYWGDWKADMLWQPVFEGAVLPNADSIWAPIDPISGRMIGNQGAGLTNFLIRNYGISDEDVDTGGFGLRVSHTGQGLDTAVTVQRARPSLPYPELDPVLADAFANNQNVFLALQNLQGAAFKGVHPQTWAIGTDGSLTEGPRIWRAEANYLSDVPYTDANFQVKTSGELRAGLGVEYYPGDSNLRVLVELNGRQRIDAPDALDNTTLVTIGGQIEQEFGRGDWRASVNFRTGLGQSDIFVNPEISYTGFENHEISLGYYQLGGAADTTGGFYDNNDMVAIKWRLKN